MVEPERVVVDQDLAEGAIAAGGDMHGQQQTGDAGARASLLRARELLEAVIRWNTEQERPLSFSTQITVQVADDAELLRMFAENPRLRPHLHISLQSGSDGVLKRMKRPYRGQRAWDALRDVAAAEEPDPEVAAIRSGVGATFNLCHWLKVEGDIDPTSMLKAAMPRLMFVSINGADGGDTARQGGMVLEGDEYHPVRECRIESDWDDDRYQTALRAWARTDEREYEVTAGAERILDIGPVRGWTMVSMRDDWITIFD